MKSPILDPYQSMGANVLKSLIPKKSVVESYFLYSGELEINLSSNDRLVISHTCKYPIYEFWWMVKNQPYRVAKMAENVFSGISVDLLYRYQENWHEQRDPVYRSALFYILNRCSDSRLASSGKINKSLLSPLAISRFKKFSINNLYVVLDKNKDIGNRLNEQIDSDVKLFPVGRFKLNMLDAGSEGTYEREYINHQHLYKILKNSKFNWVVLYKFNSKVVEKTYQKDNCEEIIVTNF